MRHVGDITQLSGYELPVVDCITGGSPCQDLSVAGKRAGLAGERSGLFMEQMRIVKEMRELDRNSGRSGWAVRPRYLVWENVDGARTSPGGTKKGEDFAAVIEEIIKVAEPGAAVRVCVPDGGWTKSGCYYAEDGSWSIAWRVHDAQFWGVPQRRKRIALVADFGGLSAPEILFERKGLSWHPDQSRETLQKATRETGESAGEPMSTGFQLGFRAENTYLYDEVGTTVCAGTRPGYTNGIITDARGNGGGAISPTITGDHQTESQTIRQLSYKKNLQEDDPIIALSVGNGQLHQMSMSEQSNCLDTMHDKQAVLVTGGDAMASVVRRLTPLE